jgi:hypothetical protein
LKTQTSPKPSLPLAVSTSAIFWSVAWAALIREIVEAPNASLSYVWLQVSKDNVIKALIVLLAIFTFIFVRWLAKIQNWTFEVSLKKLVTESYGLIFIVVTVASLVKVLVDGFGISSHWAIYAGWAIWIWAAIPFFVIIIPEKTQ